MKVERVTPILNVSDVPASLAWFAALGWERGFSWNSAGSIANAADRNEHGPATFAGVCSADAEIFLCKDAQGSRGGAVPRHVGDDDTGGVWMSWWMRGASEVDELYALALQHGFDVAQPPCDKPWGVRECHLHHPDGHTIRVSAGIGE
ncbi:MAG TPA: VOC family protein [Gammaproteobacteria bacterium]|nr:VOC family protein [Gammaproteobacteria bacterium]